MQPMEKKIKIWQKNPLLITHYQAIKKLIFFTEIQKVNFGGSYGDIFPF